MGRDGSRATRGLTAVMQDPSPRAERARDAPNHGWRWWYPLIVLVPALFALGALVSSLLSGSEAPGSLRGARLGMTPAQVRDRFAGGEPASWETEIDGADLTLIRGPSESMDRSTRFEFHGGMLVAIRADLPEDAPEARGEAVEISAASVVVRDPAPGGRVHLRVIARDCPTHAPEVSRVLSGAD